MSRFSSVAFHYPSHTGSLTSDMTQAKREMTLPWDQYSDNAGLPSECLTYAQRYKGVRALTR